MLKNESLGIEKMWQLLAAIESVVCTLSFFFFGFSSGSQGRDGVGCSFFFFLLRVANVNIKRHAKPNAWREIFASCKVDAR